MPRSLLVPASALTAVALCLSCDRQASTATQDADGLFLDNASRQVKVDRLWLPIEPEVLFTIPNEAYPDLYRPADVKAAPHGGVLVYDFAEMAVKRFDTNGSFVAEYGEGQGQGPGELQAMMDIGTRDSLIYIVDDNNARFSYYDQLTGTLAYQEPMDDEIGTAVRTADTPSGGRYVLVRRMPHLLAYTGNGYTSTFGSLIEDQQANYQILDGRLAVAGDDLLYVTSYHPRIYRYDSTGTLVYVRTTIDQDFQTNANVEVLGRGNIAMRRARGLLINGHVGVEGSHMWLHSRSDTSRTYAALDFYDISNGDYEWSIKIPEGAGYLYLDDEVVYSLTDTLVTAYSIPGWEE